MDAATWLETTKELRMLGWRVTLIAAGPSGPQQCRGVEVHGISRTGIYFIWQFSFHLRLLLLLRRQWSEIDVILFHQMSAVWLLPLRAVRFFTKRHRPLIVMDTRTVPMASKEHQTWKQRVNGWFHSLMNVLANQLADGQTAITRRMAEAVRIPPKQLWGVWPSGVNPSHFAATRIARRWPTDGEAISLVYVGSLNHERNLITLGRAVEAVNAEGLRFTMTAIGSGTGQRELEDFASGTERRIQVLQAVPYEQIPQHLENSHVGLLPFPDEEKFRVSSPIKLFEYMAAGLPVLATRIVCHTDVVRDGGFAFWAENARMDGFVRALRQIWAERSSLRRLGIEAAAAAQSWTWAESAGKLQAALEHGIGLDQLPLGGSARPTCSDSECGTRHVVEEGGRAPCIRK
jgi:glycosyltransferase involved in cell wall biosynthesis